MSFPFASVSSDIIAAFRINGAMPDTPATGAGLPLIPLIDKGYGLAGHDLDL
jgi:hypothetical protein